MATFDPDHLRIIPIEFDDDFRQDPRIAWQSFGDQGLYSAYPYFENIQAVHSAVLPRENPFDHDTMDFVSSWRCTDPYFRFMHIDLGLNSDSAGIAMCHIPEWKPVFIKSFDRVTKKKIVDRVLRPLIRFDFIGRIVPPKEGEIIFGDIREVIFKITERGFPIQLITYDRFQSVDSIQILRQHGYVVAHLSLDRCSNYPVIDMDMEDQYRKESTGGDKFATLAPWRTYKTAINQHRVELPYYRPMSNVDLANAGMLMTRDKDDFGNTGPSQQLTWIEKETLQATFDDKKLKVIEPPRGSIDLLEAVAGAAFNAVNNVEYMPPITDLQRQKQRLEEAKLSQEDTIFEQDLLPANQIPLDGEKQEDRYYDDSTFE